MQVTSDLLAQWEPKIHRMLRGVYLRGMDYEDAAQELRIALARAVEKFDAGRHASFHTFLHTVLANQVRTLIAKAVRTRTPLPEAFLQFAPGHRDEYSSLSFKNFTSGEAILVDLILCGYNIAEIERLSVSKQRVREVLRQLRTKLNREELRG